MFFCFYSCYPPGWSDKLDNCVILIIGAAVALYEAIIKDFVIGDNADWRDTVATITECIWSLIAVVLGVLFNQLS